MQCLPALSRKHCTRNRCEGAGNSQRPSVWTAPALALCSRDTEPSGRGGACPRLVWPGGPTGAVPCARGGRGPGRVGESGLWLASSASVDGCFHELPARHQLLLGVTPGAFGGSRAWVCFRFLPARPGVCSAAETRVQELPGLEPFSGAWESSQECGTHLSCL